MQIKTQFLLLLLIVTIGKCYARVHEFETSRLKSTAGAGSAALLLDEGTILNPAGLAFFHNITSLYLQRTSSKMKEPYQENGVQGNLPSSTASYSGVVSDTKSNLKGSLGYFSQKEGDESRKRISAALASSVGQYSTMGFQFRRTKDVFYDYNNMRDEVKYQMAIGAIHAINDAFTVAMLVVDPFQSIPDETRFTIGAQYFVKDILSLMLDLGSDYHNDLNKSFFYKTAIQLSFFSDLYVRLGIFKDGKLQEKGTGLGLGWISPKMIAEFGFKNTERDYNKEKLAKLNYPPKKLQELAFSLGFHF